ncbi:MAG: rhomboid family intramembrane serine protease [Treponema sp.]|nr:rhomboid family intramembrane serine protease [Treponema sp.]
MNIIRRPFRYTYDNMVFVLIGLNVLVFAAMHLFRDIPIVFYLAMNPILVMQRGWVWQFVTYMFVHSPAAFTHILFNMLALFIFGRQVEQQMGSREFLLYYLLTGTMAGVFSFFGYLFTGNYMVFLMGASGAMFAVQLAFAAMFPRAIIHIWGILPVRAPILVLGFTGLSVFFIVTGAGGNVAHATHLLGFVFGWLYFVIRFGINPWNAMRR